MGSFLIYTGSFDRCEIRGFLTCISIQVLHVGLKGVRRNESFLMGKSYCNSLHFAMRKSRNQYCSNSWTLFNRRGRQISIKCLASDLAVFAHGGNNSPLRVGTRYESKPNAFGKNGSRFRLLGRNRSRFQRTGNRNSAGNNK